MALTDLSGIHVLVVDDDEDSRTLLRKALEYYGAFVSTAASADEAWDRLRLLRPHVIVTDIVMPDDGLTLFREIQAVFTAAGIRIPVIAITAFREREQELIDAGIAEIIEKPLNPMLLCGAILRHAPPRAVDKPDQPD